MQLKSSGRISPFEGMDEQIGNVFTMLHQAVGLFGDLCLQPPHWDREPTQEMLKEEEIFEKISDDAAVEIRRLACEIFKSLTGETVLDTKRL